MTRDAYPITLYLPGGLECPYIDGSRPARYVGFEGSVEIPDDLKRAGWFWFGSFLSNGSIAVYTGTFGIEGTFEQARAHHRAIEARAPRVVQLDFFDRAA